MVRFLALGDSYTIGESVRPTERWPAQLAELVAAEGIRIDEVKIVAATGWTTGELLSAMEELKLESDSVYDLVSLLIGVNNQYRGRDQREYRQEFNRLIDRAIALAGRQSSHVMVLSIPDWAATPFAAGRDRKRIAKEIDAFNAINREESERRGASYVDVTPVSRLAQMDLALVAPDGLHPSSKMYSQWAALALPSALAALRQN